MNTKILLLPNYRGEDKGDGGIRRVVEAQRRYLPDHGFEFVDTVADADLVATHATLTADVPVTKPWVTHCHGLYFGGSKGDWEWPAAFYHKANEEIADIMRRADAITVPSRWVAHSLERVNLRPEIIGHGIHPEDWPWTAGGDHDGYVLWNKSRVDEACDPTPVIELAERLPDVRFLTTFVPNVRNSNLPPNVKVTGRVPYAESKRMVTRAGVYLATTRETFGIGTLEAMVAGVPVVGWDFGGQSDYVRQGYDGWLVAPGDYDALAAGVRQAIRYREMWGQYARAHVLQHYTWEQRIGEYAALYQAVVDDFFNEKQEFHSPRTSVVVPCYKLAHLLPDTLTSLAAQTDRDFEVVVVDDASPDNTREVVANFQADHQDMTIRYLRHSKNQYLAAALNSGAHMAMGRYILPLDADNMIAPDTLRILGDALDADRGISIAYGRCQFVLEDGKTPDTSISADGISRWPFDEFHFDQQMQQRNQIPSTSMYRYKVFERVGGYRSRWRTSEDADFWMRAVSYGAVPKKVTDATTLIYRQREDSMSRTNAIPAYSAWVPWANDPKLTPWIAAAKPVAGVGAFWPVPTWEFPRVTVVIPVGPGHERAVVDAIDSVDAQTFRAWECVVVNDTGLPLGLKVHIPPWVRMVSTEGERGPAVARNLGMRVAKGEYILPLDADDYLQPNAIASLLGVAGQWPGYVVYSQWWEDYGGGKPPTVYNPPQYDPKLLLSNGCIHAVTALYPRAALEQVGGFDEQLTHWEDWDMQIRLAQAGVCGVRVDAPLWMYRKHLGQRREANIQAFDAGKAAIMSRWGKLWSGEEQIMACGCSSGKVPPAQGANNASYSGPESLARSMAVGTGGATVLLEYTNPSLGKREFRGRVTGTRYVFGNDDDHRVREVAAEDADGLLNLGQFAVYEPKQPEATEEVAPATGPADGVLYQEFTDLASGPPEDDSPSGAETVDATEPVEEAAPLPEGDARVTVAELRETMPKMNEDKLAELLALEKSSETPRATAIQLLERALQARTGNATGASDS